MFTLLLLSLGIFLVYNAMIVTKFGIPTSLSDSYYLLGSFKKGLGVLFTLVLYAMSFLLLPAWFEVDANHNFDFLLFFSGAMLAFVGAAPAFRGIDKNYHGKFAAVCAATGILWILLATPYWPVLLGSAVVMMGLMWWSKTKNAMVYWLEMIMFVAIYTINLIYYLK